MATLSRPSFADFMAAAREDNPDASDDDLSTYYRETYGSPTSDTPEKASTLPSLPAFLKTATEDNPDVPEHELRAYWQEEYGSKGARESEPTGSDVSRGFSTAFKQIPQLAYGAEAGLGAAGEALFGEGGVSTAVKQHGLKGFEASSADIEAQSKSSDSFTTAFESAKTGDIGALADFLQYGLGYAGGQAVQMLATGGLGFVAGKIALQPVATALAQKMVAKEAARLAASDAGKALAASELTKQATANVAGKIGQMVALAGTATGMEGGEIGGGLAEQVTAEGRVASGEELAKAFGFTLAAGGLEFVGDKIGLDLILGKPGVSKVVGGTGMINRGKRAIISGGTGVVAEGATEFAQTLIEELGQGKDPFADPAIKNAIDAAALGGVMGGAVGTTGGLIQHPPSIATPAPASTEPATDPKLYADIETDAADAQARAESLYQQQADQATIKDILSAPTVDDAIAAAGKVLDAETTALAKPPTKRESFDAPILPGAVPTDAPGLVPGQAFTPRTAGEPDPRETIEAERQRLAGMRRTPPTTELPTSPELVDAPLQTAAEKAYTTEERARIKTQQELLERGRVPQKREAYRVPLIEPGAGTPSLIIQTVPPSAIKQAPELTPKERIAAERAKLLAMRVNKPVLGDKTPETIAMTDDAGARTILPTALQKAYPSVQDIHRLAESKGLAWDNNQTFIEMTRMITGKAHLDDLTPRELQKVADRLNKIQSKNVESKPTPTPTVTTVEGEPALPLEQQTERLSTFEAAQVPRGTLIPEQNAEMLARAEKAQADLEIAGSERGTRVFTDTQGQGSTQEVTGLKSATAAWYKEATTGPKKLSRDRVDAAVAKIIADKGRDVGSDVQRIKELLLQDQEFTRSEFAPKTDDEWKRLIEYATGHAAVEQAAHEAATSPKNELPEPSDAQIEAGNYKKSHVTISGLDISLENPEGSTRSGTNKNGKPWSITMKSHYGYVRSVPMPDGSYYGPKGRDKEHLDIFVRPGTTNDYSGPVFVIDQVKPDTGSFDEVKIMLGYGSVADAKAGYLENYADDWSGLGNLTPTTLPQLKLWLRYGRTADSFSKQPSKDWTKAAPGAARETVSTGVPSVAANEGTVPQSEKQKISALRRKGHNGVPAVAGELPGISERRGDEAIAGTGTGQEGQRQRIRAGEREVGDAHRSGKEPAKQSVAQVSGENAAAPRLGEGTGNATRSAQEPTPLIQVERGEDTGNAGRSTTKEQPNADARRADQANVSVGKGSEFGLQETEKQNRPRMAGQQSADRSNVAPAKSGQQEIAVPPPTIGERPIIAREATPEEAPLFSRSAQTPEPEQTALPGPKAPTAILAEALRTAADQIEGKEKIVDVGERIGGARKDLAEKTGTAPRVAKPKDDTPGWRKRYVTSQILRSARPGEEGKWSLLDTKKTDFSGRPERAVRRLFDTKDEAEAAIPLAAVSRTHRTYKNKDGQWEIYRKIGDRKIVQVVADTFPTEEDAQRYMVQHAEQIIETKTNFGEEILPRPETVTRTGEDRRNGKHVNGEDFRETFNLRSVEFGNWQNQDDRQEVMNHAYDGLLDLAEILGIPAKAIGLNGELALAFGSRGHGLSGAAAHYEREYGVINLTKMQGAGHLAHEWFHATDHYFGRQDTKAKSTKTKNERGDLIYPAGSAPSQDYVSHGFSRKDSGVREVVRTAYTKLIDTMFTRAEQYTEDASKVEKFVGEARNDVANQLDLIRNTGFYALSRPITSEFVKRNKEPATAEQLAEFDGIAEKILNGEFLGSEFRITGEKNKTRRYLASGRWTNDGLEKLSAIHKAVRGRSGWGSGDVKGVFDDLRGYMNRYSERLKMLAEAQAGTEKTKQIPTEYAREAKSIDQGRVEAYWLTPHEMAARAFAAYVEDKLKAEGKTNDFIVYNTNVAVATPWGWKRPYPTGEERKAINAEFDKLFEVIETKETDQGTALFEERAGNVGGPTASQFKEAWKTGARVEPTSKKVIDSSQQFPAEMMRELANQGYVRQLAHGLDPVFKEMVRVFQATDPGFGSPSLVAFSPDDYYVGVNLRGPDGIILNPWGALWRTLADIRNERLDPAKTPEYLAARLLKTMVHELTHQQVEGHDATFDQQLEVNYTALGDDRLERFQLAIITALEGEIDALGRDLNRQTPYWQDRTGLSDADRGGDAESRPIFDREDVADQSGRAGPRPRSALPASREFETSPLDDRASVQRSQAELTYDELNSPEFPGIPLRQRSLPIGEGALAYEMPAMSNLDAVIRTLQDKNIDLVRLVETIKATGKTIADDLNPVLKEEMYMGRTAQRLQDFLNEELRPLVDAMRLNKVTMAQLDEYLHARHAQEANAYLQEINAELEDNEALSGMTDEKSAEILAAADRPKMERLAGRVDAILHKSRDLMVDYGLESPERVESWENQYSFYVPLHRAGFEDGTPGTGQGRSIRGSSVKTRTGSKRSVIDILANVALDREKTLVRGEKMRPTIALAALLQKYPNPEIASLAKPAPIVFTNPETGLLETAPGDIGEYRMPMVKGFNKKTGQVEWRPDLSYKGRPNVINFRLSGKDHAIVFNEENPRAMAMAAALKDLDVGQLNGFLASIAPVTRFISAVNTVYSPIFGITNFVRDIQFAMLSLSSTPLAGKRAEIARYTMQAIKGIYADARAVRRGDPVDHSPTAELWRRFQKVGGPTGYKDTFRSSGERARAIEHLLDPNWWHKTTAGKALTANGLLAKPEEMIVEHGLKPIFSWLQDYNGSLENAVRLGTFKAGIESGMTDEQAASAAKNLTVNFNRRGTASAQLGALYAFFNASAQGTSRVLETLFEPGKVGVLSAVGKKIIAGGVTLGALQTFALSMAGLGDDEPPEWLKAKNLIIPVPGTEKSYVSIPMPLGFHVLPAIGRLTTEALWYGRPIQRIYSMMGVMLDAFSPVGGSASLTQFIAPSVADPLVALGENQDWSGREIYRPNDRRLNPTTGMSRARSSSTPWSRGLATAINYLSGGTEYMPGKFSPTPEAIDYLLGQASGGIGREVSKASQTIGSLVSGEDLPAYKIPLAGRFIGSASGASAVRDEFYRNVKELNTMEAELTGRKEHSEDAAEFMKDNPSVRLARLANNIEREVSKLNKQKRDMIGRGASREQVKLMDMRIAGQMQRLNQAVAQVVSR